MNGGFKTTGHSKISWLINKFLCAIHNLLKNYPSRRADYIYYSSCQMFPLKFCSSRWLGNSKVMERAKKILPYLQIYVDAVKKPPISENYNTVVDFLNDKLLDAKLGFMISVSVQLEPFLQFYQSNAPLLPFLYEDLHEILKSFLSKIVKSDIMEKITNAKKLVCIDLADENNLRPKTLKLHGEKRFLL